MGRYSTELAGPAPGANPSNVPFSNWPTSFNKPIVSLDLNGLIIQDVTLVGPQSVQVIPGVLDAIKMIRLKGHKLIILSDQPDIFKGKTTQQNIESCFQELMKIFGQHGIMTIDGFLFNTSDLKEDEFAKPNLGMVKRAESEMIKGHKFKDGWYVGDSLIDLKFADKMGAKPVLIKTGNYQHALEQLEKFTYRELKQKTKIHNSLLEFANTL